MDETDPLDCFRVNLFRALPAGLANRLGSRIDVCGPRHRVRAAVTAAAVQPAHTDPDATCDASPTDDHPKPSQRPQEGQPQPATFHLEANDSLDGAERSCARVPQDRTFRCPAIFSDSGAAYRHTSPFPCASCDPETLRQPTAGKRNDYPKIALQLAVKSSEHHSQPLSK